MKNDYEQRRQKRIENAKSRAEKNIREAEELYDKAKGMASVIPFGQPILVGHHSEKRDRNYRDKIHNTFGRSFEKSEKAEYYKDKAETIENNDAISSDDPQALQKLRDKLRGLKESQEFMKAANKCIRKKDKEGFLKLPYATEQMWTKLIEPNYLGIGFAPFSLKNNNANIRAVENRIKYLEQIEARTEIDLTINGVRIYENHDAGRLQLFFPGKPSEEIRKQLKKSGFRWSPSQNAWQRHISPNAIYLAKQIVTAMDSENKESSTK